MGAGRVSVLGWLVLGDVTGGWVVHNDDGMEYVCMYACRPLTLVAVVPGGESFHALRHEALAALQLLPPLVQPLDAPQRLMVMG